MREARTLLVPEKANGLRGNAHTCCLPASLFTSVPRSAHEPPHVEDGESKLTFELAEPLLWIDCPDDFKFSQQGIYGQASGLGNLLEAVAPVDGNTLWAHGFVFRKRAVARSDWP
jgi:hypothetical protein